jgi:hypothetical protein
VYKNKYGERMIVYREAWGRGDSTMGGPDDEEEGGSAKRRKKALPVVESPLS